MKTILLVTSSNNYYSLLNGFEYFLGKNWKDLDLELHYCLEDYSDIKLNGKCHFNPGNKSWSDRLETTLKKINTDNIILMCEDYYVFEKVDNNYIKQLINCFNYSGLDFLSWTSNKNIGFRHKK
jgi:hypothetical protein